MDRKHRYWKHKKTLRRCNLGFNQTVFRKEFESDEKDRKLDEFGEKEQK